MKCVKSLLILIGLLIVRVHISTAFLHICSNGTNEVTRDKMKLPWFEWGQLYSYCMQYESSTKGLNSTIDEDCTSQICRNCLTACKQSLSSKIFNATICTQKCTTQECRAGCKYFGKFYGQIYPDNSINPKNIPENSQQNVNIASKSISNITFHWSHVASTAAPVLNSIYLIVLHVSTKGTSTKRTHIFGLTAKNSSVLTVPEICSTYGLYGRYEETTYTLKVYAINYNGYNQIFRSVQFTDMKPANSVQNFTVLPNPTRKDTRIIWKVRWAPPLDVETLSLIEELVIKDVVLKCRDERNFEKLIPFAAHEPVTVSYSLFEADVPVYNFEDALKTCTIQFQATTKYGSCLLGRTANKEITYEGCHLLKDDPCPVPVATQSTTTTSTASTKTTTTTTTTLEPTTEPTDQPLLNNMINLTRSLEKCINFTIVHCPEMNCRKCIAMQYDILVRWQKPVTVSPILSYSLRWGRRLSEMNGNLTLPLGEEENGAIVKNSATSYLIQRVNVSVTNRTFSVHVHVETKDTRTLQMDLNVGNAKIVLPGPNGEIMQFNNTNHSASAGDNKSVKIAVAVSASLLLLISITAVILHCRLRKRSKKSRDFMMKDDNVAELYMDQHELDNIADSDEWEIIPRHITLDEKIGEGAFGTVFSATINVNVFVKSNYAKLKGGTVLLIQKDPEVAVKLLKEGSTEEEERDFKEEILTMKEIGYHKNIVNMIGCSTVNKPLLLVVEYMEEGDLLNYLRRRRKAVTCHGDISNDGSEMVPITADGVLSFAWQIASGMEYLASKNLVHRDLAARNILVGPDQVAKIADFGLTRFVSDDLIYMSSKSRKLPVKWMSVEAIFDQVFTTFSDVWAYGVVLFEVVTLGGSPYPALNNRELLSMLKLGHRMEKPENCADEIYDIMLHCWNEHPLERPSFTELREHLENIMCQGGKYLTFDINENSVYYNVNSIDTDDDIDVEFMKKPIQVKKLEKILKEKLRAQEIPILPNSEDRYIKRANDGSLKKASNAYINTTFNNSTML